jgi:hypothetical protein
MACNAKLCPRRSPVHCGSNITESLKRCQCGLQSKGINMIDSRLVELFVRVMCSSNMMDQIKKA